MAILTAFLVACVLALSTAKGSLVYIFLIYILLLCCKIIFQFNSNFYVSDLTWASHDSFSSVTTPKNLISETCFISVGPIIIGGILSFSLSFSCTFIKGGGGGGSALIFVRTQF